MPDGGLEGAFEVRGDADFQPLKLQTQRWRGRLELLQDRPVGGIRRIPEDIVAVLREAVRGPAWSGYFGSRASSGAYLIVSS